MSMLILGYFIILSALLYFKLLQVSQITRTLLVQSVGPVCMSYLLYRWGKPLLWLWSTTGGKLVYVLGSATVYTACKTLTDRVISSILQTNASHFPNAQNSLTLYFLILGVIFLVGITMQIAYYTVLGAIIVFGIPLLAPRIIIKDVIEAILRLNPDMANWRAIQLASNFSQMVSFRSISIIFIDTFAALSLGTYITIMSLSIERPSWLKDESGQFISFPEQILIWSSFYPNKTSESGGREAQHLICKNLPPNANVTMANPNDFVPKEVIVAEVRKSKRTTGENAYTYKLLPCENTNNPDNIRDR